MPTYEYVCRSCATHLEVVQRFDDTPLTECPTCGGSLRKVFGSIGIAFKGSGFYKNDSRSLSGARSGPSKGGEGAKDSGDSGGAGGKDSGDGGSEGGAKVATKEAAAAGSKGGDSSSSSSSTSTKTSSPAAKSA